MPRPVSPWSFLVHLQVQEMVPCTWTAFTSSTFIALLLSLRVFSGAVATCSALVQSNLERPEISNLQGSGNQRIDPQGCSVLCVVPQPAASETESQLPTEAMKALVGFPHFPLPLTSCLTFALPRCASGNLLRNKLPSSCLRGFLGGI